MRLSALIIASVVGLCAAPGIAAAVTINTVPSGTIYEGNSGVITIPVTASVGGVCGFAAGNAPDGTYSAGEVSGSWSVNVPFKLNCNVASRVAIRSSNGGLKSAATIATGYTNLAPYNVTLTLNGNAASTVTGTCAVATLTTAVAGTGCAAGLYGNPASTTAGLRLNSPSNTSVTSNLVLNGTAASGILVNSALYTDTLTVTISAAP